MMEIRETIVPATTKRIVTYTCDLCGKDMEHDKLWNINTKCYLDNRSPDFAAVHKEFDFCGSCMENRVIALISATFNIKPR